MTEPQAPPLAPADTFTLTPSPTPGYQAPGNPSPNPGAMGFMPQAGEGNAAAQNRVIETVLEIARGNGQSPADSR